MKHLTLVILLALAPLSWGEDVWYCVEENRAALLRADDGSHSIQEFQTERFTLKHDAQNDQLVFSGRGYSAANETYAMDCDPCGREYGFFGTSDIGNFRLTEDGFYYASTGHQVAWMINGTCTTF